MRLLFGRDEGQHGRCVILFGSGLIGSTILRMLHGNGDWSEELFPYSWSDGDQRHAARAIALADLTAKDYARCDVIWSAGVSGFGSDAEHMKGETAAVREIAAFFEEIQSRKPDCQFVFHLISSAGGLFEGLTQVDSETRPQPLRPYGQGKLEQESIVRQLPYPAGVHIYRPTSVYGYHASARRGLFAVLIGNALLNKPSLISGLGTTLRDYVYAEDVGRFIAQQIEAPSDGQMVHLLGSGRPTSMYEAIALIEDLLQRPIYRRYEPHASNASNMSFSKTSLPDDWVLTPLATGLASVFARMRDVCIRAPGLVH